MTMGKRITAIEINNYRGYFGKYKRIIMQNGENILIYGENGSGKSSLYKALNDFFSSSRNPSIKFTKNSYNQNEIGEIDVEFSDFDNFGNIINGTNFTYQFTDTTFNHNVQFIQNAALVKGFLDYTDLLKIYFHDDPQPNLFNLVVLIILGDHIPISSGGHFKFKEKWNEIQNDLRKTYNRNSRKHKVALNFLPIFETQLRATLDEVFEKMNIFLRTYFIDFNIELEYILLPLKFNYVRRKTDWHTTTDLRLVVKNNGQILNTGYSNYLNEARLSAIAICMYLASLSVTNKNIDLKVLYLDDVFIGLDSGNRIPILNILRNEFSDYQKFISTYDRHWFELAKRQFQIYNEKSWKYIEMYVGHETISNGDKINKPIINTGLSYAEKGTAYLHHSSNPDYPAAANYYRKALEELISTFLPKYELADTECIQIPEYKLGKLFERCYKALEKVNSSTTFIKRLQGYLFSLLHPLSHHEITSLIYKHELEDVEHTFYKLKEQLSLIDFKHNYKCIQERGSRLRIHFVINLSTNHIQNYELILKESLLLFKEKNNSLNITKSDCYICKLEGTKNDNFANGKSSFKLSLKKDDPKFRYSSLFDAVNNTYIHITTREGYNFVKPINYLDVVEYFNGTSWVPISKIMIW